MTESLTEARVGVKPFIQLSKTIHIYIDEEIRHAFSLYGSGKEGAAAARRREELGAEIRTSVDISLSGYLPLHPCGFPLIHRFLGRNLRVLFK
jgi:hypothetical protein